MRSRSIKAADLFCGAGGSSTGLSQACAELGVKLNLIAVNHWNIAIETHSKNHPEAEHLCSSLDNVDPRKLVPSGRLNLLVASPECFPAGTLILAERGLIPIEEIRIGDLVLTHKGRWREVKDIGSRSADTIILNGQGHSCLEVTREHPLYVRRQISKWNNEIRRYRRECHEPEWVTANSLTADTYRWATPTNIFSQTSIPEIDGRSMPFDNPEFWWLVGRWLADGTVREERGEITIATGGSKVLHLKKRLDTWRPEAGQRAADDQLSWRCRRIRTAWLFECAHLGLAKWLVANFGKLAHGKTIPAWALSSLTREQRQGLLDGYISGDGHMTERFTSAATVSKRLGLGLRLLAESLGYRTSFYFRKQHADVIEGRRVKVRDLWVIRWESNRSSREAFEEGNHSWSLVKRIAPGRKNVTVYNLSVDEDESYVADGIVAHNCTHHSVARGGKPINDQSRASAWRIVEWCSQINIDHVLIENVKEFQTWGPLGTDGRPLKKRKGEIYIAFLKALESLGYVVEARVLNAADFGDPTSRERLFIQARRGRKPITWPEPTHSAKEKIKPTLFDARPQNPHRPAREIIDWSIKSQSIYTRRRPLKPNTLARIFAGLRKFCGLPFIVPQMSGGATRDLDQPVPTITTTSRGIGLCQPFIVVLRNHDAPRSIDEPLAAICAGGLHQGLVEPFIVELRNCQDARSVDDPLSTITTLGAHHGLCQPFLIRYNGNHTGRQDGENRNHSLDEPLRTLDTSNRFGLVQPFLVNAGGPEMSPRSVDAPLNAILTRDHMGLVEPFIIGAGGPSGAGRPQSINEPLNTVLTENHKALIEPFIVSLNHGEDNRGKIERRCHSVNSPLPTVTTINAMGLIEPFLTKYNGTGQAQDLDEPLDTVTSKDRFGLVEPELRQGEVYGFLDIRFRMLQPHELAAAMSFPRNYFFFGNREQKVKQIGNAVPVNLAKALCKTILSS